MKEIIDLEKLVISKNLYGNELVKAFFAHDAAYSDSEDLAKWTILDKILKDRANEIARNRGFDGYQRALESMVYKFFDKKTGSGASFNEQLAEWFHKPVTKKFKRRKVYARFKDNILAADLGDSHCLQRLTLLNIYFISDMFSLNMCGLNV